MEGGSIMRCRASATRKHPPWRGVPAFQLISLQSDGQNQGRPSGPLFDTGFGQSPAKPENTSGTGPANSPQTPPERSLPGRPAEQFPQRRVLRADPGEPQGLGHNMIIPVRLLHPENHRVRVLDHPPVQVLTARLAPAPDPVPDTLQTGVRSAAAPPNGAAPAGARSPGPVFARPNSGPAPVGTP